MLRAILFDFDGVIADSETLHLKAFQKILKEEAIELPDEAYYTRYLGLDDNTCIRTVLQDYGQPSGDALTRSMVQRKSVYYATQQEAVTLLPGAEAFIRHVAAHYPLAIGSGALRQEISHVLRRYGVDVFFRIVVSADDIQHSKPAPDVYLKVLEDLNTTLQDTRPLLPAECVVIEDARHGIAAAHAAGMRCIAVATSYPPAALQDADLVVDGMQVLTLKQVERVGQL